MLNNFIGDVGHVERVTFASVHSRLTERWSDDALGYGSGGGH